MLLHKLMYFQVLLHSSLLCLLFATGTQSKPAKACQLTSTNYKIHDSQECDKYYECSGGNLTAKYCEQLFKFSKDSWQCEDQKMVNCSGREFSNKTLINTQQECQHAGNFLCKYGKEYISREQVCDGDFNCLDASDEKDCEIHEPPKLLIAFGNTIKTMIFNTTKDDVFATYTIPYVTSISAVVYNPINHTAIFGDSVSKRIYEFDLTRKSTKILVSIETVINGMDIDLVSENLYWVDSHRNINLMSLRTLAQLKFSTLATSDMQKLTDIVIVPGINCVFIAGLKSQTSHIYKMSLDLHVYKEFIFESNNSLISSLFYDRESFRILWTDQHDNCVKQVDLSGRNVKTLSKQQNSSTINVVKFKNQVFWTNRGAQELKSLTLNLKYFERSLRLGIVNGDAKLAVINRNMSSWENLRSTHECSPVSPNKTGCSHMCLPALRETTSGVCKCPENFQLNREQINCISSLSAAPQACNSDHSKFRCKSGDCINRSYACDGDYDCKDGSDEEHCNSNAIKNSCSSSWIRCNTTRVCMWESWVCDGIVSCPGGQDEENCYTPSTKCQADKFRCEKFGRCIPKHWQCDYEQDCGDGDDSDEIGCAPICNEELGYFKCSSSNKCIPEEWVCDYNDDCEDGTDEVNCDVTWATMLHALITTGPKTMLNFLWNF